MKAYKGFNKDMTCRNFQYEEGETYTTDNAELCKCGFHACEDPLNVFAYYAPANSVYHEVELDDVSDDRKDNTKVCAKSIKIGAKLSIKNLIDAHIEFVRSNITEENKDEKFSTAGYLGVATAGEYGAATAGYAGSATAGNCGSATAGKCGSATAGDHGVATSRGKSRVGAYGIASARGNNVKVCGGMGAILIAVEEESDGYSIKEWKAEVVDGVNILPDVWYKLKDGKFVEAEERRRSL